MKSFIKSDTLQQHRSSSNRVEYSQGSNSLKADSGGSLRTQQHTSDSIQQSAKLQRQQQFLHSSFGDTIKQSSQAIQCKYNNSFGEFTKNAVYAVNKDNLTNLYVEEGKAGPIPKEFFEQGATKKIEYASKEHIKALATMDDDGAGEHVDDPILEQDYVTYSPKASLLNSDEAQDYVGPNDCGAYAVALITNTKQWQIESDTKFRNTRANMKNDYHPDGDNDANANYSAAVPGLGGMYNIQWEDGEWAKDKTKAKHHVSTVVAADDGDEVTSEAHSSKDIKMPEFALYGTESGQSFYDVHQDYFTRGNKKAYMVTYKPPT